jgi:DNA-directed RNA polymerase specialized sigma24 family protein
MTESPEDIVSHANICIETLMRLYYMRHSYDSHHAFFIYFFMLLGNMAIETRRRSRSAPDSQKAFARHLFCAPRGWRARHSRFTLRI